MSKSDQEQRGYMWEKQSKIRQQNLLFKPSILGSEPHLNMVPLPIWNPALCSGMRSARLKCGTAPTGRISPHGHPHAVRSMNREQLLSPQNPNSVQNHSHQQSFLSLYYALPEVHALKKFTIPQKKLFILYTIHMRELSLKKQDILR